jgi:hypothetical protein
MNGCQSIKITKAAQDDLLSGYWFYERQQSGIGTYFLDSLTADIDGLLVTAGVHIKTTDDPIFRSLASRFPFAIHSIQQGTSVTVLAVLDTRSSPEWLRQRQISTPSA